MPWLRLQFDFRRELQERVESALEPFSPASFSYEDGYGQPILEPGPGETPLWPVLKASVMLDAGSPREAITRALLEALPSIQRQEMRWSELGDQEWQNAWRQHAKARQFGQRLWVCPSGEEPLDHEGVVVFLDPGIAFGTGAHPTTDLCLRWLEEHVGKDFSVLDFGCGSGVLGIAARRLGARFVEAVDIDPQAREAARQNAQRNGVLQGMRIGEDCRGSETFDLVVANILANTLIDLAEELWTRCRPAGRIALSGILRSQSGIVKSAFDGRVDFGEDQYMEDWALIHGIRIR